MGNYLGNRVLIIVGLILFVLSLFLRLWRFSSAPDIFGDEVLYCRMAIDLPVYGQLMAFGKPWFVHPPLYFMTLDSVFQWMGLNQVTLDNVFNARLLTSVCSALTVPIVFIWITKASNYKIGFTIALLLVFEPYALKFGRIGILESMVMLFIVISLYLFWEANEKGGFGRYILAGVFFGLSLLTKELALFLIVPIAIWWLLTRYFLKEKVDARKVLVFLGTGLLMYLRYVVWALLVTASIFLQTKIYLIQRVFWIIKDTGYTNPAHISFAPDFMETAYLYIATYVLLAIAPFACLYMISERKQLPVLLASWAIGSAIFFLAIGIHNPQFFVYVTVSAVVVDGYALSMIYPKLLAKIQEAQWSWKHPKRWLIGLMAVLLIYNAGAWYTLYGVGTDDAFSQSISWIEANIPRGTEIVSPYTYEYFLKDYKMYDLETTEDVKGKSIHYFITSPRWTYLQSNDLQEYIKKNGRVIETFYGTSLRKIDIYYIENPL